MEENKKELNLKQLENSSGGEGNNIYPPKYCPVHKEETHYYTTIIKAVPGYGISYVACYRCCYCDYEYEEVLGPAPNPWGK